MINRPEFRILLACFVYVLLLIPGWHFYQYIFDVDGIGYAAIAEYYVRGELREAINGQWSPLHCWLIIPFIKIGISSVIAFKITNTFFALGILYCIHDYLRRSDLKAPIQLATLLTSVIILTSYTWHELAADLLLAFILLLYFKITISDDFHLNKKKVIVAGLLGGFAYLTKAYAFPFFLIHFFIVSFFLSKPAIKIKYFVYGLLSFFLVALPWIFALWWKYGEWLTSTTGKVNWSWYLVSPYKDYQSYFLTPPHPKASCSWEDPYFLQNKFYKPWHSCSLFIHQIRFFLFSIQQWLLLLFYQSFLVPGILTAMAVALIYKPNILIKKAILFCLLLPAGYWLVHIEGRFIWATTFIYFVTGIFVLKQIFLQYKLAEKKQLLIWFLFFGSFLAEPVNWLKDNLYTQKEFHELSNQIKNTGIKGKFTSNKYVEECSIIAYKNKFQYFNPAPKNIHFSNYVREAKANGINHYFFFYNLKEEKESFLNLPEVKKAKNIKQLTKELVLVSF